MTKPIGNLNRIFTIITLIVCSNCTTNDTELSIDPEIIKIKSSDLSNFLIEYNQFYISLTPSKQNLLQEYIDNAQIRSINDAVFAVATATCQCQRGQNSCSASGWISDCCICWWPETQNGVCGTILGVGNCQVEERKIAGRAGSDETYDEIVTFYSNRFNELLDFAQTNQINVKNLRKEFNKLKGLAIN